MAAESGRVENHFKRIGVVYPFMVARQKGKVKMKCRKCGKEIAADAIFSHTAVESKRMMPGDGSAATEPAAFLSVEIHGQQSRQPGT